MSVGMQLFAVDCEERVHICCPLDRDATGIHQCLLSRRVSFIEVCVCYALCKPYHAEKFTYYHNKVSDTELHKPEWMTSMTAR